MLPPPSLISDTTLVSSLEMSKNGNSSSLHFSNSLQPDFSNIYNYMANGVDEFVWNEKAMFSEWESVVPRSDDQIDDLEKYIDFNPDE
jgi:hypothetical protein